MEIVVTVLVLVVVLGFALWVFSRVAGAWLHRGDVHENTAEQWYGRFDDSKRR